ncbi:MAG: hypothetical protein VB102_09945 [Paludibacter sp.]|nr:hypothetical protein [Paludibacter sp.]
MVQLNKKLIVIYTIIVLIAGWGGWWLLNDIIHLTNMELYPAIPVFFYLMGISTIMILTHINRENNRKVVNVYMILKLVKFLLAAIAVLVLFLVAEENKKALLLTFASYYFLYIICEVYIFSQVEKTDKALQRK